MMWNNSQLKNLFLLLVCIATSGVLQSQNITQDLPEFSELKVFNGVVVELHPASENSIEITGHSKEKVKFEVVDNRLELRLSLGNIWADDNTLVILNVRSLEVIDANEGSVVEVKEKLEGNSYTFRSQEGAAIYASVQASEVSAKAVTAGIVQLRGTTARLEVDVNTGGRFFGEALQTEKAEVKTGTGGQIDVNSSEYLKATASLGGSINVFGNPKELDRKTSLGGKILEKN